MNSKPKKTKQRSRSGRIVGSLVIATCLFLGVVWLLGHFLIAKYPDGDSIASATPTSFDSTNEGSANHEGHTDEDTVNEGSDLNVVGENTAEVSSASSKERIGLATIASDNANTIDTKTIPTKRSSDVTKFAEHATNQIGNESNRFAEGLRSSVESAESQVVSPWNNNIADSDSANADIATTKPNSTLDFETADDVADDVVDSSWDPTESVRDPLDEQLEGSSREEPLVSFDNSVSSDASTEVTTFNPAERQLNDQFSETVARNPLDIVVEKTEVTPTIAAPETNPTSSATGMLDSRNRVQLRPAAASSSLSDTTKNPNPPRQLRAERPVGRSYPIRTWTSSDQRQVDAHFVSVDDNKSVILSVRGKLYRVPLTRLSKDDLNYLKTIQDPALSK